MKTYCAIILATFLFACSPKPQLNSISISLTNNKKSLQFKGLDQDIIGEVSRDTIGKGWQGLVPVYRMPADTDMKSYQPEQPGKYQIVDSMVVFTPDTPFAASQTYFVRWYRFDKGKKASDYLRGQLRPGQTQFTDLIFKQ
ncbi:hypothetical protein IDJ77_07390 [Mucilaginibacter sp. ZT4R22]|uniref:Lipoprotein n=1 Tax=Mucilaginibacter pankratovii TaxID=2772110 RepID=A0ABR7WMU5_9SPHI|nr:hypothetical protein [Mucilaginibacter pankratovii]MBD1363629.1 hypothetical protein [Mucilaginibacter pankratovii]